MRTGADQAATLFLTVMLVFASVGLTVYLFFTMWDLSCVGDHCRPELKDIGMMILLIGSPLVILGSIATTVLRRRRNENTLNFWVPLMGIGIVVVLFIAGLVLNAAAMDRAFL